MTDNPFQKFWQLGYTRLVPIIPPKAPISERSSLARALNTKADPRGKAVGIKGRDGNWFGFDWLNYEADEEDIKRWHAMGAGVGIKTGNGIVAIDADTKDNDHARTIRDVAEKHFGRTPVRVGNFPKALYLLRVSEPYRYTRVEFGPRNEQGRLLDRVEILSDGRQFVAHGIHPNTQKPYHWPRDIEPIDDLTTATPQQLDAFMAELSKLLPSASDLVREGATTNIPQASLKGELQHVRKAVQATKNTNEHFPTREHYRDYGYAIKAALPDNEREAFEIFADWCDQWVGPDGETNDPDVIASDWRRMKPPYKRGASFLYELAEQHSGGSFSKAEVFFDKLPDVIETPFDEQERKQAATAEASDTYRLLTMEDIVNRPPPKWLVDRYIPEQALGFLYSDPGAGKSFLSLDLALHIAYGAKDWHGDAINADENATVIYIAGEGSYGFRNRIAAFRKVRPFAQNLSKRFLMIEQGINFLADEDIKRLLRTLAAAANDGRRPCLVFVDTVSRALPGADENLQKDMTLFVKACDAVKERYGCTVIGVHHAGKSGDMRGSTVLRGAGDFVLHLERKKGASVGVLTCEKQKDGPDGWHDSYTFDSVSIGEGETSLTVARIGGEFGPSVDLTPDLAERVLAAMAAAWDEGRPWSKAPQAKDRYAVKRMVSDFGFDGRDAENTLGLWEATGLIVAEKRSSKLNMVGFKVTGGAGQDVQNAGIFG